MDEQQREQLRDLGVPTLAEAHARVGYSLEMEIIRDVVDMWLRDTPPDKRAVKVAGLFTYISNDAAGGEGGQVVGIHPQPHPVRVMLRAQFIGVVRLVAWTGIFLFGRAVTILHRLGVSKWATRLVHPHADFDALNRQVLVSTEESSAVAVAQHNGRRLIEHCDAGKVASPAPAMRLARSVRSEAGDDAAADRAAPVATDKGGRVFAKDVSSAAFLKTNGPSTPRRRG